LKGIHVDVGNYRGAIRVSVSISARPSYTPGEPVFVVDRVSKVTGPDAPVGLTAIQAQSAPASSGSSPNAPRPGPAPAPLPGAAQTRTPLQPSPSALGSRP